MTWLLAFLCGAAYEAGCVAFIHFSERGRPVITALCSMFAASAELAGIVWSVQDVRHAPVFIAGYGFGTWAAVSWKARTPPPGGNEGSDKETLCTRTQGQDKKWHTPTPTRSAASAARGLPARWSSRASR